MSSINLNQSDAMFSQKLLQFETGMAKHGDALGFSAEAEASASAAADSFATALTASDNAKAIAKGAVATKDATRKSSTATVRALAAQVKSNPLATPEILADFGMNPSPSTSGTVKIPTNLVVQPQTQGFAKLTWKRNGNTSNTVFVIQARTGTGQWTIIGTSTKSSFIDPSAIPAVPKWYRVRAERGGSVSAWTNEVSIYSAGESTTSLMVA